MKGYILNLVTQEITEQGKISSKKENEKKRQANLIIKTIKKKKESLEVQNFTGSNCKKFVYFSLNRSSFISSLGGAVASTPLDVVRASI